MVLAFAPIPFQIDKFLFLTRRIFEMCVSLWFTFYINSFAYAKFISLLTERYLTWKCSLLQFLLYVLNLSQSNLLNVQPCVVSYLYFSHLQVLNLGHMERKDFGLVMLTTPFPFSSTDFMYLT